MKKTIIKLCYVLTLLIFASSCTQSTVNIIATVTPLPILTSSNTPNPSSTPTATFIPITPAFSGTQAPNPQTVISTENADRLAPLARWGNGNISDAQYTPDGKYLITACSTGIYFYNTQDYSLVKYIDLGTAIFDIAVTQDGKKMAAASLDKVFIFNQDEDKPVLTINEMTASLAFSPDGQILALGTYSLIRRPGNIKLWDIGTGTMIREFEKDDEWAQTIAFSPDGTRLAAGGYTTQMWSLDGKLLDIHGVYVSGGNTLSLSFSPDGTLLAEGAYTDNILHVWRVLKNGRLVIFRVIALKDYPIVFDVSISPDGKLLAVATSNGFFVWELSTRISIHRESNADSRYSNITWSMDSKSLAAISVQHGIEIWDVKNDELKHTLNELTGSITGLAWLPDSKTLVRATNNGGVSLIESRSGRLLNTFESDSWQNDFAISPDENWLAIKSIFTQEPGGVVIHNLKDSTFHQVLAGSYGAGLTNQSFSQDGKYLVTSGFKDGKNIIQIWNTKDWSLYKNWSTIDSDLLFSTVAFYPDGQTVAVYLSRALSIQIYKIADGSLIQKIETMPSAIAYSPNGQSLLSLSEKLTDDNNSKIVLNLWHVDGSLICKLDNLATHKAIPSSPPYYRDTLSAITFSPSGELFAVGFADGNVGIFTANDGQLLQTLNGHTMRVMGVAFSPDGKILASASLDGTIRLWGIK